MNVIITARWPSSFLKFCKAGGYEFRKAYGREWLLQGEFGFQQVAIVVCERLPLNEKYFEWIFFAPSNSKKWQAFVDSIILSGEYSELLEAALSMRPVEVFMAYQRLKRKETDLDAKEQ